MPDHRHALGQRAQPPRYPPVGSRRKSGVATHDGQVPCGIERERALDWDAGNILELILAGPLICPRTCRQDHRVPPEPGKVTRELQGALDPAASCRRRKMIGDHEEPLQETPPPSPSTISRTVEAILSMSSSVRSW